jgi:hypothetical protein
MARVTSLALIALLGCGKQPSKLDAIVDDPPPGVLPRARMPIVIDGDWGEPAWNLQALRGVFTVADGKQARPYSEIRLLRDDRDLLVALYAADEDIESADTFELTLGSVVMSLHPIARLGADAPAGARVGVDLDGTLDHPSDDDEEWVVELALPLSGFAPGPLAVSARRCDLPKDGRARCGQWSGTVGLPAR